VSGLTIWLTEATTFVQTAQFVNNAQLRTKHTQNFKQFSTGKKKNVTST